MDREGFWDFAFPADRPRRVWPGGPAPVELADAGRLRTPFDYLLAGSGPSGPKLGLVRRVARIPWPALPQQKLAWPHDRAVGTDASGGTGKVPRRHANPMREGRPS